MSETPRRLKPLRPIALGLLVVLLVAPVGSGYDALPDFVGWLLVLACTPQLPDGFPRRRALGACAALAAVVSALTWPPSWGQTLIDAGPALAWTATLPQVGWSVLVAFGLARLASAAGDLWPSVWLKYVGIGYLVVGALPVIVYGGGVTGLEGTLGGLSALLGLVLFATLLLYSSREWASRTPGPSVSSTHDHEPD